MRSRASRSTPPQPPVRSGRPCSPSNLTPTRSRAPRSATCEPFSRSGRDCSAFRGPSVRSERGCSASDPPWARSLPSRSAPPRHLVRSRRRCSAFRRASVRSERGCSAPCEPFMRSGQVCSAFRRARVRCRAHRSAPHQPPRAGNRDLPSRDPGASPDRPARTPSVARWRRGLARTAPDARSPWREGPPESRIRGCSRQRQPRDRDPPSHHTSRSTSFCTGWLESTSSHRPRSKGTG